MGKSVYCAKKEEKTMKIKAVCEKTGLTDRTVRFYIEEGLLSPKYKENYLRRKTFDFSDEDVRVLQSISVFQCEKFRDIQ